MIFSLVRTIYVWIDVLARYLSVVVPNYYEFYEKNDDTIFLHSFFKIIAQNIPLAPPPIIATLLLFITHPY